MSLNSEMPNKFFLHGHSFGGYISSLFACVNPDRIEALFLNSAIGAEAQPTEGNPLYVRLTSNAERPSSEFMTKIMKSQWDQ